MISYFAMNITCNGKFISILCSAVVVAFFVAMDTHLYFTLQKTSLVHQDPPVPGKWSPFKPLSMKLILTDPYNHYVMGPSAEYFDEITGFSKVLYFITPNMISITHVITSIISAKLVASESLAKRRFGILLYQFRSWLDDLDGVVFRSHNNQSGSYRSNHNTLGYYVDIYSDIVGGIALMFGVLFYLYKSLPVCNGNKNYTPLPLTKPQESKNGSTSPVPNNSPNRKFNFNILSVFGSSERPVHGYTKKFIFYKVLCVGLCIAIASGTWDKVVEKYTYLYQTDLKDPVLESIQSDALHSGSMWLIIYMWRIWEGQCIVHMICIAVFIDKIWEFLTFFQYLGYIIIFVINLLSFIHINQVRQALKM
ncbi:ceramide phosphoethanolamine synthase-like [Mya arenaria]|uniref:ceramide phosphoethanolamine synthase-like n=1 Tax=Mya arenaria TaxID=6604 RepID=UPI0022DF2EBA|nr:ceramide phosphoethanolamine synthase-like [Mya arenaria]XP_052794357.1 ceramide phosphoethanolamine synthase-like [Mya arenaria]XP_052794358.1 ceramide phosphoethanolamine synthase-like [Mya arenaria]XP_052794359.1 ceramide phosphoethanolamine synthase-like [Mya arenaria]